VPANVTLECLHDVIQILMGWADYHLHHFQFGEVMYGMPSPEDREMNDGRKVKLSTLVVDGERAFQYLYDYGDGWCCMVVLEAVTPTVQRVVYPRIVEGARRGPPEDVGGPWSSWTPSRIQSTSVTRNCSNGAAATSTRNSSMSTNSIAASPRSRPARAPAASPLPAELAGGPHRTHAFSRRPAARLCHE